MKFQKCTIILLACFLWGCATPQHKQDEANAYALPLRNTSVASGIRIHDKMYWETGEIETVEGGKKIGSVVGKVEKNEIPLDNMYITKQSANEKGETIYELEGTIYIKRDNLYRKYQYINTMKLATRVTFEEHEAQVQQVPEEERADDMPTPHVVYQNMTYCIRDQIDELPSPFQEVGKVREVLFIANENFTGSGVNKNDTIYASEEQNKYMIVKTKDTYNVFENTGYEPSNITQ